MQPSFFMNHSALFRYAKDVARSDQVENPEAFDTFHEKLSEGRKVKARCKGNAVKGDEETPAVFQVQFSSKGNSMAKEGQRAPVDDDDMDSVCKKVWFGGIIAQVLDATPSLEVDEFNRTHPATSGWQAPLGS